MPTIYNFRSIDTFPGKIRKWKPIKIVFTIIKKPHNKMFRNVVEGDKIAFILCTISIIKTVVCIVNNYFQD